MKYRVSGDVLLPFIIEVEADSGEQAEAKVRAGDKRHLLHIAAIGDQLREKDERIAELRRQRDRAWDRIEQLEAHIQWLERTRR